MTVQKQRHGKCNVYYSTVQGLLDGVATFRVDTPSNYLLNCNYNKITPSMAFHEK